MAYPFPPVLDQLVREELATGVYRSEDEVLVEAMQALRDRDEAIAGIREGLADLDAGRVRSLGDVDAELRTKHAIAPNA
jgi:predicted transcriptional regulator